MSDISKSNSSIISNRRISEIDETIAYLTHEVNQLNDFVNKTELECSLTILKLKREKVKALSAVARSQVLLADMEVLIAESDLLSDVEKLRNFKKLKLDRNEGESSMNISKDTPTTTTKNVSVQTTKSMAEKKTKRKHSSSKNSSVDIYSDETMLIPTIFESTALVGMSHASQSSHTRGYKSPANKSDSEVSLSSSIKAEFNEPYTKTQESVKKSPAKKHKSGKKSDSKSKSTHSSKRASPTITTKTVAEINRSVSTTNAVSTPIRPCDKNASTSAPIRHNMPVIITKPGTSSVKNQHQHHQHVNNPIAQASLQYHSQGSDMNQIFTFYGTKQ